MPVSLRATAVLLGSLMLGVPLFADDAPHRSPGASDEALMDRLDRLEEEIATLSVRAPNSDPAIDLSCHCCQPQGWFATVDWINWQVRQRERNQILAGVTGLPFLQDTVRPVEFNRANGVRASLGYEFIDGWQLAFIYSYLHPHGKGDITQLMYNDVTQRWRRDIDLDYDVFDLQVLRPIALSQDVSLSVFGGVRRASLSQQYLSRSEYFEAGVLTSSFQSRMAADSHGTGMRVGGTAEWQCVAGLSLFGGVAGSVLVQESRRTFLSGSNDPSANLSDSDSSWDGLPILETSAGVAWVNGGLSIKAGYELASWLNVTEVGLVPPEGLPNQTRSLTLDGVFIQLSDSLLTGSQDSLLCQAFPI